MGGVPQRRRSAQGPARHDADPRLRRAHALVAAPGQDVVLHHLSRRGGDRDRASQGPRRGRHVFSDLPPAGPADRPGLADRRYDVRNLLERERSSQRPSASRALFVQEGWVFLRLRQPRHTISASGWLGDGVRNFGRYAHRVRLDRRRIDRGKRFPCGARVRLRLPAAGHSQRGQQSVGDLVLSGHRGG